MLYHTIIHLFLHDCARDTGYQRLSRKVCGEFDSPPSGTGGWVFCLAVFDQFYTIPIYIYFFMFARGNRVTSASLERFAAILIPVQAEQEGGYFVSLALNNFIPYQYTSISSCLRAGYGLPAPL